ncbi:Crp-Fnr regulatory protein (FnrL) [Rhodobacterales bacterium HTCC2150]|nr:Crp-Fnr regulatory protein (FnrL) [Rhodobacterales bacterium HTCC2150] [Rhodobacteraceae bacterium HTCC2150]
MERVLDPLNRCESCPIRHRAVCATCDTDELAVLESIKYYRSFEAGQPIIFSGDQMEFVASIVKGAATIEQIMEDGRKQTLGLLLPSDFIGRPGRENAIYDVTAVTDITLCCFRRGKFETLIETTPHIAQRLLAISLDELDAARDWMLLLGRKTAREKIATFLMMIVRRTTVPAVVSTGNTTQIELPLTREAMADYLGLTIETVSRQFSALRKEGLIALQGKRIVDIPSISHLRAIAGSSTD